MLEIQRVHYTCSHCFRKTNVKDAFEPYYFSLPHHFETVLKLNYNYVR
jgi:hypothetical protein